MAFANRVMFVFALALLAHRAAAKCNGLASNGTDAQAVSPIDVCMASMYPDGVPRSRKYVCQEGVGYVYAYNSSLNCTGAKTSQTLSEAMLYGTVMICDGEACPYVVTRNYYNNTEKCIDDGNTTECTTTGICAGDGNDYYFDDAIIADRCFSIGDGNYGKATCDADLNGNYIADLDEYTTADCSGTPINSTTYGGDEDCRGVQLCNSSAMMTTTEQPQGNGCKGVSLDNGQMYPLDVCSSTRSPLGNETISQSRKTVCENGVGYVYAYSTEDCSGTPQTTSNISEVFGANATLSCDGETCPYLVYRTSFDSNYSCSADDGDNEYYGEVAMIADQCMQSESGGGAYEQTCTSDSTAVTNVYLSADCSGTPISSTSLLGNLSCAEITHCDVSDDTTTPAPVASTTAQPSGNGCKGVSLDGVEPLFPLDVCTQSAGDGNSQSTKYACQDGKGVAYAYSNLDCSGTPIYTSDIKDYFGPNATAFCDGESCAYFILRTYSTFDENATCTADYDDSIYYEYAAFVDRCIENDGGYGEATCESGTAVLNLYADDDADCSGTPVNSTSYPDDQPCVEITYCGSLDSTTTTTTTTSNPDSTPAPTSQHQNNGCKGVSQDNGEDALYPLDVCTQSRSPVGNQSISQSRKTVCQDGVGYVYTYSNEDCSGTPQHTTTNLSDVFPYGSNSTVFCDGETCPYFIYRGSFDTLNLTCSDSTDEDDAEIITEIAVIVNRCLDAGDGEFGIVACESSSAVFNTYAEADCSGTPVNSTSLPPDDQPCVEITYCGSLDTTTPAPTDQPQSNGCKGVSLDGVDPVFPLDVCTQSAGEGNSQSTKYSCQDGVGYVYTYMNLDCSGTPNYTSNISSFFGPNATAFCDGESCAYFTLRTYTTFDENATCTADYDDSNYYEYAAFVDRCIETDGGYGEATCESGTAVLNEYADDDADCSGTPVNSTSLPDDQPCVEITYCGSNAGDKKDDGVSVGVVVGAVIGGLCVMVIVGLLVFRLARGQSAFKKDANERLMDGTEYNRL